MYWISEWAGASQLVFVVGPDNGFHEERGEILQGVMSLPVFQEQQLRWHIWGVYDRHRSPKNWQKQTPRVMSLLLRHIREISSKGGGEGCNRGQQQTPTAELALNKRESKALLFPQSAPRFPAPSHHTTHSSTEIQNTLCQVPCCFWWWWWVFSPMLCHFGFICLH